MYRVALILFLNIASALGTDLTPDHCHRQVAEEAPLITEPVRLLATSASKNSIFSVAVLGNELHLFRDKAERVGKVFHPDARLERLRKGNRPAWGNIVRLATADQSESVSIRNGLIAIVDSNGGVFVTGFPNRDTSEIILPSNSFPVAVSITQDLLTIFTTEGIYQIALDQNYNGKRAREAKMIKAMTGLIDGVALSSGDFVLRYKDGLVKRFRSNRFENLGEFPQGIVSMSAYLMKRHLNLWLVDTHGAVFEWRYGERHRFVRHTHLFPEGVRPVAVATAAARMIPDHPFRDYWAEGFYARTQETPQGTYLERVLFVGSDGRVYSPWSMKGVRDATAESIIDSDITDFDSALTPVPVWFGFNSLDPRWKFPLAIERLIPGSIPVSPVELGQTLRQLTFQGFDSRTRSTLVQAWLRRLQYERYIEEPNSGISEFLDELGVPLSRAHHLIFLDCLSDSHVEPILSQRDLEHYWREMHELNRILKEPAAAFRSKFLLGLAPATSALHHLIAKLGGDMHQRIAELVQQLEKDRGQPAYQTLIQFVRRKDPLWNPNWD